MKDLDKCTDYFQAKVQCWDNSTRGLDASNALDFARVLRRMADQDGKSIVATLYQAGNAIYAQFDKVLVLAEGREIYYGPASQAKQYFEDMGFRCAPGANIADFLTSVAVETEREILAGFQYRVPNTPEQFEAVYKRSAIHSKMMQRMNSVKQEALAAEMEALKAGWKSEKNRSLAALSREKSPYHVSFPKQVLACTKRYVQISKSSYYNYGSINFFSLSVGNSKSCGEIDGQTASRLALLYLSPFAPAVFSMICHTQQLRYFLVPVRSTGPFYILACSLCRRLRHRSWDGPSFLGTNA
jgi:hypothetical protein